MKQTQQQAIDETNYRYRLYIEDLQEEQLSLKKRQQAFLTPKKEDASYGT